jgi:hypothetical protein
MVIVLGVGPNVRGFTAGQERYSLRAINIRSMTSFGRGVKSSAPCLKTLQHVKNRLKCYNYTDR